MGEVLRRDETSAGDPHEIYYRFAGKQRGFVGNNGMDSSYDQSIQKRTAAPGTGQYLNGASAAIAHADFDQSLAPITSYVQGSASGSFQVRAGDTLSSIAAQLYGDGSLWYALAEANGLTGNAPLNEGQLLTLPAGVVKNTHNADTFTPYDPTEALGNTSPTTPRPNKKNKNCGGAVARRHRRKLCAGLRPTAHSAVARL